MKKNFILMVVTLMVIAGCSTEYDILKSQEAIILTADTSVKKIGEPITFTVKNGSGDNLTEDTNFFVDGTALESNTFTSTVVGNFKITAIYNGIESAPLTVNFHDGKSINFKKKMLVEDYTGVWCGYCPRVAFGIEQLHLQTEDAVTVAIHRSSSKPSSSNYDPYNFNSSELERTLSAQGYPKGFLNRTIQWTNPEPDNLAQAIALTQGENPKLGLAMTSVIENGTINMDVNVMFGKDFGNNLKLVVYVLENGLIYDQHNYTSYYNDVDVLVNYTHNHVLRACLTSIMGDGIDPIETKAGATYKKTYSVAIPENVADTTKMEFVAFVIDETGTVVNVRKTTPGENQQMELL
ncbi:Outer membrane protein Omp28 [compost metagenome]